MTSKEFVARRGLYVKLTYRPNIAIYKLAVVEYVFSFSNSLVMMPNTRTCQFDGIQTTISSFTGRYSFQPKVSSPESTIDLSVSRAIRTF